MYWYYNLNKHPIQEIQYPIYHIEDYSADEIRQISSALKGIIKPKKSTIDIEVCEKLNNYIVSISAK